MAQHVSHKRTVIIRTHPARSQPSHDAPAAEHNAKVISGYIEITVYESLNAAFGSGRSRLVQLARLHGGRRGKPFRSISRPAAPTAGAISSRNLRSDRKGTPQSTTADAPACRSSRLEVLLHSVVEDPEKWMATPSDQFGGRSPSDLVGTDEEVKILDLLNAVDQGLF